LRRRILARSFFGRFVAQLGNFGLELGNAVVAERDNIIGLLNLQLQIVL
jgi:hypothetical protein